MTEPLAEELRELIESGRVDDAVQLTGTLSPSHIGDLIFLAANENPSKAYLTFLLVAAEKRSGTLDEVGLVDQARALLVTALAPLENSFGHAFQLHLRSIELQRVLLEESIREISFFKATPDRELDSATEERLRFLADALSGGKTT